MKNKHLIIPMLFGILSLSGCSMEDMPDFSFPEQGNNSSTNSSNINVNTSSVSFDTSKEEKDGVSICSTRYNMRDVTDSSQEYVLRSLGNQNILVIPVTVKGFESNATEQNKERIEKTFFGKTEDTSWESLASFYEKSSYGKLKITGTVSDWYECGYTASQIASLKAPVSQYADAYDQTWTILEKAVAWYKKTYKTNCQEFDNDNDGYIDGVWLVYSAPNYSNNQTLNQNIFWAYTYADYDLEQDLSSPNAFHYCWASFDFMNEGYGKNGIDAHTYIHESGHLMGLDDYYDYNGTCSPVGYVDMMDGNIIDHCAFSKFALGWVEPYVVSDSCEIVLKPASTSGQCIILPTEGGFNGSAFDEYIMIEFYTPDVLNAKDSQSAYTSGLRGFTETGVRVFHIDARLASSKYNTSTNEWGSFSYTDTIKTSNTEATVVGHTNTPSTRNADSYNYLNPQYRLIQAIDPKGTNMAKSEKVADNNILFKNNSSFSFSSYKSQFVSQTKMNDGTSLSYSAQFSEMTNESVKVTISKA